MFLRDLYASLKRRWYFMVAGILLTAALVVFAYSEAPVKYEATGSVALVPPPKAVISGDNPFLYMSGLEQALGVLTVKVNSPEVQRQIVERYPGVEYTTARDPSTNGPIVLVSVTGASSEDTLGALRQVLAAVPENLAVLQDTLNLTPDARMATMPLALDEDAEVNDSARTRVLLALVASGAAVTLLITGQLDKILLRRRSTTGTRRTSQISRSADRSGNHTKTPTRCESKTAPEILHERNPESIPFMPERGGDSTADTDDPTRRTVGRQAREPIHAQAR